MTRNMTRITFGRKRGILVLTCIFIVALSVVRCIQRPPVCTGTNEFFQSSDLTCQVCPDNQEEIDGACVCMAGFIWKTTVTQDATTRTCDPCPNTQFASLDRTFCLNCGQPAVFDSTAKTCTCSGRSIAADRGTSGEPLDTSICLECPTNAYPDASKTSCLHCPDSRMVASAAIGSTGSFSCACPASFTYSEGRRVCLVTDHMSEAQATYPIKSASQVNAVTSSMVSTTSEITVESDFYSDYFTSSYVECKYNRNVTSCQMLGNLCVLQEYRRGVDVPEGISGTSSACKAYEEIARDVRSTNADNYLDWPDTLPWLYYGLLTGEKPDTTITKVLDLELRLDGGTSAEGVQGVSTLPLVIATYTINGSFVGYQNITNQLQLCSGFPSDQTKFLNIGTSTSTECTINFDKLKPSSYGNTLFHDMYIYNSAGKLEPVPVRILGPPSATQPLVFTSNPDTTGNFVRRFYLVDNISSRPRSELGDGLSNKDPLVIRWASSIRLKVTQVPGTTSSIATSPRIFIPVLEITYSAKTVSSSTGSSGTATPSSLDESGVQAKFQSVYQMDYAGFWQTISIVAVIVGTTGGVGWMYQNYVYSRRHPAGTPQNGVNSMQASSNVDFFTIIRAAFILAGIAGPLLALMLFGISMYWILFFKQQSVPFVFILTGEGSMDYLNIYYEMLIAAFILQAIHIIRQIVLQCQVDVFYLDWEKPRGTMIPQDTNITAGFKGSNARRATEVTDALNTATDIVNGGPTGIPHNAIQSEAEAGGDGNGKLQNEVDVLQGSEQMVPVSVWRMLFAANQWKDLQVYRKLSVKWTLFWMFFLMQGSGWRSVSYIQSDVTVTDTPLLPSHVLGIPTKQCSGDQATVMISPILLFGINTLVWLLLCFIQYAYRYILYDRFYVHKWYQYTDLLSLSNISMIILDEPYHGYYVHGRSVHAYGDTDMFEMSRNLQREEQDLVGRRGLHDTDGQVYEWFVDPSLRQTYDKIFGVILSKSSERSKNMLGRLALDENNPTTPHGLPKAIDPSIISSYYTMNQFLRYFFDRNLKEFKYSIRDKTYIEKIFGVMPFDRSFDSMLFNDESGLGYTATTLYGIEWGLQLMYILFYNVLDVYTNNMYLAVLFVFLLDVVVVFSRRHFGTRNLARKSLVDIRFLV